MKVLQPTTAERFRLAVFIAGETFMLLIFLAAPLSLSSLLITLGGLCALYTLWRYGGRP